MELIGLILSMQHTPFSRPEEDHMDRQSRKSLSDASVIGQISMGNMGKWSDAGSAACSLYLDTAGCHGCRRGGLGGSEM